MKNKLYTLLRKSEKIFKTDMIYLAKGSFWVVTSQVFVSLLSLLFAIAFARLIPKETYGEYKYVLSIASILSTFTLTGLGTAVTRSVIRGYEGSLDFAFWKNIKWSIGAFFIALGLALYYFTQGNNSIAVAILIAGSFSPFFSSTNLYNSYLIAKKDFRRSAIYFDMIGNFFPFLCLTSVMFVTNKALWLILVYFASNTLIGLISYLRIKHIFHPNNSVDPELLSYSKHLSVMNILSGLAGNIDQILVFHYVGAAQLAIYNFATAIPNQIKGPLKGLDGLLFPKFAERTEREIRAGMKNKVFYLFLAILLIVISYIILAPFIFHSLFPQYTSSIFYSQIFMLSILGTAFTPMNTYLVAKKKIKEQYISNVFISIFQIVTVSVSVIYWGLIGLIIARIIIRLSSNAITALIYLRSIKTTINEQ